MNFYGHATVAKWLRSDPRWVLGAMLPDFASMSRARIAGAADEMVRAGIAFHHRTDDAFHGSRAFLELYERGAAELEEAGLGRGPARAVAHVGAELVLDGLLLDEGSAADAYLEAIALAPCAELTFSQGAERFAVLADRIAGHGLPDDYRSASGVLVRLEQTLRRRPRLAIEPADHDAVLSFLHRAREELRDRLDSLVGELEAALVDTSPSPRAILRGRRT